MVASPILAPVVTLVLWTLVMEAWMLAVRIPAMIRLRVKVQLKQKQQHNSLFLPHLLILFQVDPTNPHAFHEKLPADVRWKADNYNHLMEQPTIFYAVALGLAVSGEGYGLNAQLAWFYVILRVAHSLVQSIVNHIMLRFFVFIGSSFVLLALGVQAALIVF